jgi:glycosyltransferase involved in cell wall biosynthesis
VYLRRDCLAAVGSFDGSPLGSDYAVVTDFCLRAGSAGFRHLLAADTFVGHVGHVSYGAEADRLRDRADFALEQLYPGYAEQKAAMTEADPGRPFARQVDLLRLIESPKPVLVFISHRWGGGIRRHMNDLAALAADRCNVLYLEPAVGDTVKLYWPRSGEDFAGYFTLPAELPQLAATLRAIGVARLHFHHVNGLPQAIVDLPAAVGAPYDCTLHDYYSICPQYHLVDEFGRYCGEPDATGCAACLTRRPGQWGLDITSWRGAFGRLLRGADRLIAPSNDVAQRIRRYFPELAIQVWPHAEPQPPAPPRVARVVVLGNLSPEKGLHVVAACAEDAQARRLPLTFRVLGSTTEPIPQAPEAPLTIHGQYDDAELARLLAAEKPDVVWFPAQVPETYSYTLSVALASGLPIVAAALGALPERLSSYPHAATVRWNAPAADWNAALIGAAGIGATTQASETRTISLVARAALPT